MTNHPELTAIDEATTSTEELESMSLTPKQCAELFDIVYTDLAAGVPLRANRVKVGHTYYADMGTFTYRPVQIEVVRFETVAILS